MNFLLVLWIMMPAYLANTIAVITGGRFPIDQGSKLDDGNRILGDGKTWSGLIGGTIGGIIVGYGLTFSEYQLWGTESHLTISDSYTHLTLPTILHL